MDNFDTPEQIAASMQQMQQQMQQMQQTIAAQQLAAQQAAQHQPLAPIDQSRQPQRPISWKSVPKPWISEAIPSESESESEWKDVHPKPSSEPVSEQAEQSESCSSNRERPPDELKEMMQQLLQGQQIQGKALNQVTTENNMFTELNSKYDVVASHIRQMDVQIAQTAETIKRQQGILPGKTYKNPKDCNAVELRSGRHLPDPVPKKLTAQEKGKQKEG
ncbi:hypothetical protein F2Q70_00021296 [Brassica cretica]|uniref:Uncharacterized protein n=1 Tax=Brassica cretica TaxID=69181 RepID=A0A8S9GTW5_BRACR|nr:hypothetical protein F2Q70_00021296 [Brassica cretica]